MAKLFGLALAATASIVAATAPSHGLSWGEWGQWDSCNKIGRMTKRRRVCQGPVTNKPLKKMRCLEELPDSNIESQICASVSPPKVVLPNLIGRTGNSKGFDPADIEWQEWQEWSRCSKGLQKRSRYCGRADRRQIAPNSDCKDKTDPINSKRNKESRECNADLRLGGGYDSGYDGAQSQLGSSSSLKRMNSETFKNMNVRLSAPECYYKPGSKNSEMTKLARIVGGHPSVYGEHPHIAMLSYVGFGGYGQFCDGSIIHSRYILTAAHCFVGWDESASTYEVLIGAHSKMKTETNQKTYLLENITCHPEYRVTQKQIMYDICILKTQKDIEYNPNVWPICLPDDLPPPTDGRNITCKVAGWGETRFTGDDRILNEVGVPVLTHETCQDWYNDSNIIVDKEQHVCAGFEHGGRDACQGDSGGPFVCERDIKNSNDKHTSTHKILTGIVSFGVGCAQARNPGVYTNINHFLPWIYEQINEHDACFPVNPCQHGGSCADKLHGYECQCEGDYTGHDCEIHKDEITSCFNNNCMKGDCVVDLSDNSKYTCSCDPGYAGPFCNILNDPCAIVECNNGQCMVDLNKQTKCICNPGHEGNFCEKDINECLSNPCATGAGCTNTVGGFECNCRNGYQGDGLQNGSGCSDVDECADQTDNCGQFSTCTNTDGSFKCSCPPGYTGNPPAVRCRKTQQKVGDACPNIVSQLDSVTNNYLSYADGSRRYEVTCGFADGRVLTTSEIAAESTITHPLSGVVDASERTSTDNACIFKCRPGLMMNAPAFSKIGNGQSARVECVNRAKGVAQKPNKSQLRCYGCDPLDGIDFTDCQVKNKKLIMCAATCSDGGTRSVQTKCQKKRGRFSWTSNPLKILGC